MNNCGSSVQMFSRPVNKPYDSLCLILLTPECHDVCFQVAYGIPLFLKLNSLTSGNSIRSAEVSIAMQQQACAFEALYEMLPSCEPEVCRVSGCG